MSQIVRSKIELKSVIEVIKHANKSIGLVPTMGALHNGHLSLVQMSKMQYNVTVVTIFVNPTQFNNESDLAKYPRTEERDITLLSNAGSDVIFIPSVDEIYNLKPTLSLEFGHLETIMEGKHRPGHFNGVGLIVMKLFGLVEPTGAFFGQKDLQQYKVISSLVNDFELPISLHLAPIIRESNGLAMSSRNKRLDKKEFEKASFIYATLSKSAKSLKGGESPQVIMENVEKLFSKESLLNLEYFEIVDFETLQNISTVNEGDRLALCVAATVAETRLIDNIIIEL